MTKHEFSGSSVTQEEVCTGRGYAAVTLRPNGEGFRVKVKRGKKMPKQPEPVTHDCHGINNERIPEASYPAN
ncbi:MAG: hypothetical protein ABIS26_00375 [Candidatus Paceibacterota bacterium]